MHPDAYIPLVDFKLLISEVLCELNKPSPRRRGRPSTENFTQTLYEAKKIAPVHKGIKQKVIFVL